MASRNRRLSVAGVLATAALLLPASSAGAQNCNAASAVPPGNSEVDQYVESVPGACGNEKPGGGGGSGGSGSSGGAGGSTSGSSLPASTQSDLQNLGAAGQATAALADATTPGGGNGGGGGGNGGSGGAGGGSGAGAPGDSGGSGASGSDIGAALGSGVETAPEVGDGSIFGALADALTGGSGDGGGLILPVAMLAILVGGLGFYFIRRRNIG